MTSPDLLKILKENGWELSRTRGSHHRMAKGGKTVTVPRPKKAPGVGLQKAILKQTGIKD